MIGVLGLPWLAQPVTGRVLLAPPLGAVVSGVIGLLNALLADQCLGDVKIGDRRWRLDGSSGFARVDHRCPGRELLWMIGAVANTQIRRRRAGLPPDYTPLGPSLAGGAVLAVAVAGLQ